MGEMIALKAADGVTIGAYKAVPPKSPKGGLVVVQEIFGVNHHIRSVADRFAEEGYVALAPALFDRVKKNVELAYDEEGMAQGSEWARKITPDQHYLSIEAAIEHLAGDGSIGIVGFCLGGTLAFAAAMRSEFLSASVGYYGGGIADMKIASPNCPVELHFGENDTHIPRDKIEKVKRDYPEIPVFTYPAGHGFNCDERASYDKASAGLAWTRTLSFLARNMAE